MRIMDFNGSGEAEKIMRNIGVDPYGANIMLAKAGTFLVQPDPLPCIAANILKQEMLSLGGDVAVPRRALCGGKKKTDCLIIGRHDQLSLLTKKLKAQPFGLHSLGEDIEKGIAGYAKRGFVVPLRKCSLDLRTNTLLMGIINLTSDSFSGDGLYGRGSAPSPEDVLKKAEGMIEDGADIIDLGGESTRPGSRGVPLKEELSRVIPAVKKLAKRIKAPVSIDTSKPEVAGAALEAGAQIVNDVSCFRDSRMPGVVARNKAAVVIMHTRGTPHNMQKMTGYRMLIRDISRKLEEAVARAEDSGVSPERIIIDPGLGFAKNTAQNLEIINRLAEFRVLGKPILIGPCRKAFIGETLKAPPGERVIGTAVSSVIGSLNGADIIRAHDVKEVKQALEMSRALKGSYA